MANQAFRTISLLFIDAGIEASQQLLAGLQPGVQAYSLNANQDGIQQISQIIEGQKTIADNSQLSIHIVAHAIPGSVRLGNAILSLDTLNHYTEELKAWFSNSQSITHNSQLFFYACNLAAGDAGEEFIAKLHHLTGAAIHASTTKVGNAELGGNWDLNISCPQALPEIPQLPNSIELSPTQRVFRFLNSPFSAEALATYPAVLPDTDGDGVDDEIDLDDDNDGILDIIERVGSEGLASTVYLNNSNGNLVRVDDVNGTPTTTTVGNLGITFGDIGMAPDGKLYGVQFSSSSPVYEIDPDTAATTLIGNLPVAASANALSFDENGIAYAGFSGSSEVYQFDPTNPAGATLWHDFGSGVAAGDFIFLADRAYISWLNGGTTVLREVTLDDNNNITSDTILGTLPANSFGLTADANGDIYAVGNNSGGRSSLLRLDIPSSPISGGTGALSTTEITGTALSSGQYYGATSVSESLLGVDRDTDSDGVFDHLDIDSDNDGITDLTESLASGTDITAIDSDGDGRYDLANTQITTPGVDDNFNTDGVATAANGGAGNTPVDSEATPDGLADYLDLDSDDDGIPDAIEAQPTDTYTSATFANNATNDGVNDNGLFAPVDSEATPDGTPDYRDTDSDDDTLTDAAESGNISAGETYADPDGSLNDPSTLPNVDSDDNDVDFRSLNVLLDSDGDGVADVNDLDDDNDGILDTVEQQSGDGIFFTTTGTTSDPNAISYSTSSTGTGAFTLDTANSFINKNGTNIASQPNALVSYPDGLHLLEGISSAFGSFSNGALTIDDSFEDFAGNDATFVSADVFGTQNVSVTDPDGGTYTANVAAPDYGSGFADHVHLEFTTSFEVDDISKYTDFFLEHREYLDGQTIDIYVNGTQVVDIADPSTTTHTNWEEDPTATVKTFLDSSVLVDGTNTVRFVVDEQNPTNIGLTGFAGFGRFGATFVDDDGDGISNHLDLDSDNDGISDLTESLASGTDITAIDSDGDGRYDLANTQTTTPGVDDNFNTDGVATAANGGAGNTPVDSEATPDGLADYLDLDSDDDGIPDAIEAQPTNTYTSATFANNATNDGVNDNGLFAPVDSEATPDGTPDYRDTDSDDDTITDAVESGLTPGADANSDGIGDGINASYADPDGDVNAPSTALNNEAGDTTEVAYREINVLPVANDDSFTTAEDTTSTALNLIGNDTDADSDSLTVQSVAGTTLTPGTPQSIPITNGTVEVDAAGNITFSPAPNYNGPVTFDYVISDGNGGTDTGTVNGIVTLVNDVPVVDTPIADQNNDDSNVISLTVAGNFSDIDGDTLTYSATGLPTGLNINPTTGEISGTIDSSASQSGPFTVTVTASDGTLSVDDTFTWTVNNPAPVATDDGPIVVTEDTAVSGNVITDATADSDVDGDTLTVSAATVDLDGDGNPDSLTIGTPSNLADAGGNPIGSIVVNSDGGYTFTPATNYNGAVPSVEYTLSDADGATDTATLSFADIIDVNDVPVVDTPIADQNNDDSNVISLNVAGNFSDIDGDTLTYSATGLPTGLNINPTTGEISGTIDSSASQSGPFNVTVTASDGSLSVDDTFVWTVNNPAPVATDDGPIVVTEDTAVSGNVITDATADSDVDGDALTVSAATVDLDGDGNPDSLTIGTPANLADAGGNPIGSIVVNSDGGYTFTPATNYNGAVPSVEYTLSDADGATDTATLSFADIIDVNDVPVVDTPIADQNNDDSNVISLTVAGNFSDIDGDTLTYSATGLPTGLNINPTTGEISGTIDSSASQSGPFNVTVTASDGSLSVDDTFVWTVNNPAPVATDDGPIAVTEDTAVSGNVITDATADSDVDGDALTVSAATVDLDGDGNPDSLTIGTPSNLADAGGNPIGSIVVNSDGSYTFTPATNYNGLVPSVEYTLSDADGGTDTATLSFADITDVNDAPVVDTPIADQTSNDSDVISLDVTGNFGDVDGDTLTYSATGLPTGLSINPTTGEISGNLDSSASQSGPFNVTVTASDGSLSVDDTFVWTVNNPAPVATDDGPIAVTEDTAVSGNVITDATADSDVDGDALTVSAATVDLDGDGNPDSLTIGTPANLADAGGNPIGSIVVNSDGSYTFTPSTNYNGAVPSVEYTLSDADGATDTATLSFADIIDVNDVPVVDTPIADQNNDDSNVISLNVAGNFSDIDGDTLTYSATGLPTGLNINPTTGEISGTIDSSASQSGPFNVTVTASDGSLSVDDTFVWTVNNPAPVATDDGPIAVTEDTAVSGNVITDATADSDVDGDALTVSAATVDLDGDGNPDSLTIGTPSNLADAGGNPIGSIVVNSDGGYTFTPAADYNGAVPSVEYTLSDADGATDTATLSFADIIDVNDVPVVDTPIADQNNDDSNVISLNVAGNFSDIDGDTLTYSATGLPTGLNINPTTGEISGTIDSSASQSGPFNVTVTASDGSLSVDDTFVWTVNNPAPVATDDGPIAVTEDTAVSGNVITDATADSDPDGDTLSVSAATVDLDGDGNPDNLTLGTPANITDVGGNPIGTIVVNSDGSYTFTPAADYDGTVPSVEYTLSDGNGGTDTATLSFADITDVNDAPVVDTPIADQTSNDSDVISLDVTGNFGDVDGDTLTYSATGLPTGLSINPTTGEISGNLDSSASQSGPFNVTVTASDGSLSVDDTFVWTVNNPAPVATDDGPIAVTEDTAVSGNVITDATADSDVDGDTLTVSAATVDLDGDGNPDSLTIGTPANLADAGGNPIGSIVVNSDGSYTFTPAADYDGAVPSVEYTLSDGNGGTDTATLSFADITDVNDAPVVDTPIADQTSDDSDVISLDVTGNFGDVDGDTLTYSATGLPTGLSINPTTGEISGNLDSSASQSGPFNVTVTASDGSLSVDDTFVWTVNNPAPVATDDGPIAVTEDTAVSGNVITDATADSDVDGDTLTVSAATVDLDGDGNPDSLTIGTPSNIADAGGNPIGSIVVNSDGSYTFTPAADYDGTVPSVEYTLSDADGGTDTATLSFADITDVNDAPVVDTPIADQTSNDSDVISLDVTGNFGDVDGDTLTYSATGLPTGLSINPTTGEISGNLDSSASQSGPFNVTVTASDGSLSVDDTFVWTVNNPAPVATDDGPIAVTEDTAVSGNVITDATADSDVDGDALTVSAATVDLDGDGNPDSLTIGTPANLADAGGNPIGSIVVNSDGSYTFTPATNYNGLVPSVEYTLSDADGATDTATLSFADIIDVNDAPVATDDGPILVDPGSINNIDVVPNDSDVDGDPLGVIEIIDPTNPGTPLAISVGNPVTLASGTVVDLLGDGTLDVTPPIDASANETFDYVLSDGNLTDTATVTISPDTDGDGVANDNDIDDDNDGILDTEEGFGDTDGDGIADHLDLDSDGDGLTDLQESGLSPADIAALDPDGDGVINAGDVGNTFGPNGLADLVETTPESGQPDYDGDGTPDEPADTDGDGVDDYKDLDTDNDGINDVIEAGGTDTDGDGIDDNTGGPDTDGDGVPDVLDPNDGGTPLPNPDTDSDGVNDFRDLDSDDDGINDVIEDGNVDGDGDGLVDGPDTDGDGIADVVDGDPGTFGDQGETPGPDTDGDGVTDTLDLDSDNDGINDVLEGGNPDTDGDGLVDGPDTDGDGIKDNVDPNAGFGDQGDVAPPDADGDLTPDVLDLDSDNDGIDDVIEGGYVDGDGDGEVDGPDTDGDGISDVVDGDPGNFGDQGDPGSTDTDGDGVPDIIDIDADNDGILDTEEGTDDLDGDGVPNYLDLDTDGDGLTDLQESGLSPADIAALDTDNDGVIDLANTFGPNGLADAVETSPESGDPDYNGDGTPDEPVDTDGDGVDDYKDLDTDNDGINDVIEAGGTDADGDGLDDNTNGPDADGDGLPDALDPNNGGTPVENPDTDDDGVKDFRDLDSDDDGINDVLEDGNIDGDGDGLVDGPDTDGDGISDVVDGDPGTFGDQGETPGPDTDGDGVTDTLDLDSDNDGINDVLEGGNPDTDGDGLVDGPDTDGDGIKDNVDPNAGFGDQGDVSPPDTDGDLTPDVLDLDSDNDGVDDVIEGGYVDGDGDGEVDGPDTDGDGISDVVDGDPGNFGDQGDPGYLDTDGDGIPDIVDIDSDNDGILDTEEGTDDLDGDGIPNYLDLDSDGDGLTDLQESGLSPADIAALDTDNDGVIDLTNTFGPNGLADDVETSPESGDPDYNGDGTPDEPVDTDGDGVDDYKDLDSDNDGINDVLEGGGTDVDGDGLDDNTNGPDADGDGIPDALDPSNGGTPLPQPDTDSDGVADFRDLDSDDDGINDVLEGGNTDADGDGLVDGPDTDGDGIADVVDPNAGFGDAGDTPAPDTDGDGVTDNLDLDSDDDGINDVLEGGNEDLDGDGLIDGPDTDGDGIKDVVDPSAGFGDAGDTEAPDTDGDGVTDNLDLDSDDDGINDVLEGGNEDIDGDGLVDGPDTDGDGIKDVVDPGAGFGDAGDTSAPDTDGDGVTDNLDLDSDDDGINDVLEGGNEDTDGDGLVDGPDTDGDGIKDVVDPGAGFGDAGDTSAPDTDGDGVTDNLDLDSDDDGINDVLEGGNEDLDGDGLVDGPDTDGDGIKDVVDPGAGFGDAGDTEAPDTDGDGVTDNLDLDSDDDGINDVLEGGNEDLDGDGLIDGPDTDGDGIKDVVDPGAGFGDAGDTEAPDTDGDGVTDNLDLDSDDDGINDVLEGGNEDLDGDGLVDGPDTDGDGIKDVVDPGAGFGDAGDTEAPDTDGDGVTDNLDLDSDDDGINDVLEGGNEDLDGDGLIDGPDTDGDGIKDVVDPGAGFGDAGDTEAPDTDGDGVTDNLDLDSDNDGINDVLEGGSPDTNGDGLVDGPDTDGDGIKDVVDPGPTFGDAGATEAPDRDGDGTPNYLDLDSDGDGIDDVIEGGNGDLDADDDGVIDGVDTDGDGVLDAVDPANGFGDDGDPTALDSNGDGVPDYLQAGNSNPDNSSGTGGDDVITGGNGDDIINGLSDNDTLDGGAGNDIVNGGSDLDIVVGGVGNDILNAGSDSDEIDAGDGDDIVNAGSGDDVAYGMAGKDLINGGSGDDLLYGGLGDDLLSGGSDHDSLYGDEGSDILRGGSGDDILVGGAANDLLFGGQGRDTFRYEGVNEFGDIVFDFEIVRDRIDLSTVFNGNAVLGGNVVAQQVGNHTAIMANTGTGMQQVALLMNVNAVTIDDSNFIF